MSSRPLIEYGTTLDELGSRNASQSLLSTGLTLAVEPFAINIRTDIAAVAAAVARMYGDYRVVWGEYADFYAGVFRPRGHRRWIKPQAVFDFDGRRPFYPLPLAHAYPFLEWGLNWCIGTCAHAFLIFHAAVVERNGRALIFPGDPGAGKSTLTAALIARGYRLLSDELTMVAAGGEIAPVPRPVSLKNESIEIIRRWAPELQMSDPAFDTSKGTVAHVRPPAASIAASSNTAQPAAIVFPQYRQGAAPSLTPRGRAATFMRMVELSFNYHVLGREGFARLRDLVAASDCYALEYAELDDALTLLGELV